MLSKIPGFFETPQASVPSVKSVVEFRLWKKGIEDDEEYDSLNPAATVA
jgi:hypothetical protein